MTKKLIPMLPSLFGVLLFAVMLWMLYEELRWHGWRYILQQVEMISWPQVLLALGLTVLAYAVLPGYDLLGMRYVHHTVSALRVLIVSLLSYVFSNNVGFFGLSGGAVRLR